MEKEIFIDTVMAVVGLLFIAAISAVVTKKVRFPYTIGLVVIGVAVAFVSDDFPALGESLETLKLGPVMIMFLFIPILIFESAFNTDVPVLLRNIVPTLILAGPGLLLSTALIGGLLYWLTPLPLESALIFGCLISATDPVAVIALFKDIGAPKRLTVLMEGESVFNDATAIVTFQIILAVLATGMLDSTTFSEGVLHFFAVFFGGLAVGIGFGWLLTKTTPLVGNQPLAHVTLTLVAAYGAFIAAEHFLHTSGIMAVLAAGLMVGYRTPVLYSRKVREYLEMFWEDATFVANSLIFLMLGLSEKIFLTNIHYNVAGLLYPVLIAIAIVLVVRFVVVYTLVPLVNVIPGIDSIDHRYKLILSWGGLRGAVAIALAMSLPIHFPYRWQIIDLAFAVTLFMLLFNGATVGWLMRRLGVDKPPVADEYLAGLAEAQAQREALVRVERHSPMITVGEDVLNTARNTYSAQLEDTNARIQKLRSRLAECRKERCRLLWSQTLAAQRRIYQVRHDDGLLSLKALSGLEWDLGQNDTCSDRNIGMVVAEHILPTNRGMGTAALRVLTRIFPRLPPLRRWQIEREISLYEEVAALAAASRCVLDEFDSLVKLSGADAADVENCRRYYQNLYKMTAARRDMMEQNFRSNRDAVEARVLQRLAIDGKRDTLHRLSSSGAVTKEIAERLESELEATQEADIR